MKNNFKTSMRNLANTFRSFSLDDEAGTVICYYPEGTEQPRIPMRFSYETMTGFEYSFAGLLMQYGKIEDGVKVVKAVRDRHNGENRNPWNEFECGSNYARSMASYALIPILSGFEFDMPHYHIGFNPYKTDSFNAIWSLECGWGKFEIKGNKIKLHIYDGSITLKSFGLKFCENVSSVKADGKPVDYKFENGKLTFKGITISKVLEIER